MNPEDVPEELLSLYGRNYLGASPKVAARRAMAAVLTAHERQVRERVAAEITAARPFSGNPGPQHKHYTMGLIRAARIARGES